MNLAKLRRRAPSHVLVNVDENRLETVQETGGWDDAPEIVATHPGDPEDNLALVAHLAGVFGHVEGVADRAATMTAALRHEVESTRADGRPARRVLHLTWREPRMTMARDTYLSRLLARVNWQTLPDAYAGAAGAARYPVLRGDEAWLVQVRTVLVSSEPYAFGMHHFDAARALCPHAQVRVAKGDLLSWYGARAVAGLRYPRELAATG